MSFLQQFNTLNEKCIKPSEMSRYFFSLKLKYAYCGDSFFNIHVYIYIVMFPLGAETWLSLIDSPFEEIFCMTICMYMFTKGRRYWHTASQSECWHLKALVSLNLFQHFPRFDYILDESQSQHCTTVCYIIKKTVSKSFRFFSVTVSLCAADILTCHFSLTQNTTQHVLKR